MDAYLAFSPNATRRDSSRIDQDLLAVRRCGSLASDQRLPTPTKRLADLGGRKPPHVGVVGAGVAGLRCADILLQHGFRVTVLEGRHRLGGRMHQEPIPLLQPSEAAPAGPLVDMGPNWIHGTADNPILDLVRATGTVASAGNDVDEHGVPLTGAVWDADGALLPLADGEAVATTMWTIIEEAFVHSDRHCAAIDPAESLYDFFVRRLPVHIPDDGPQGAAQRTRVLQMAAFWGAFVGSPVTQQSLKYFWLEECIEGENLFCAGTFQKVLARIAQPVVEGATMHYGQTVTGFAGRTGDANGGETDENGQDGHRPPVRVTTSTGDVFSFDEVVCTAPLGWLKQNAATAFDPPLPPRLCEAIASIGYGSLEKVYISFAEAFWQRPVGGDDDDQNAGSPRVVRGFFQWLAPGVYAQPANPDAWPQEAVDLAALPAAAAHPTLLFYLFGPQAEHLLGRLRALATTTTAAPDGKEAVAPAAVQNAAQAAFLLDYFRPYYARLPHYDAAAAACRPTGCLASAWLHDPLAGHGSYSNFPVGLTAGDEDVRVMRDALPERGLWLAGEHTAPFVALGTATGAYWSGEAVGRRIAEAYGRGVEAAADADGKELRPDLKENGKAAAVGKA